MVCPPLQLGFKTLTDGPANQSLRDNFDLMRSGEHTVMYMETLSEDFQ